MNKDFFTSYGLRIGAEEMIKEIIYFIKSDDKKRYKIIIGSDSEGYAGDNVDFATAIVIHRVGCGGRYFLRRVKLGRFHTLRDRIIQEVMLSLEVAKETLLNLKSFDAPNFDFEIHVDVGENGETRTVIQEVLGIIRAYNFEAKTKPQSYVASKVADRHV